MKPLELEITGFRSFTQTQHFSFQDLPSGFYFVSGRNLFEPQLGANGAGKSSLFESLCWLFFGETSTNLKASNIVSWGSKSCMVKLTFEDDGITHELIRTQNPNKLTLDKTTVTQDELEKTIRLDFTSFLYSILISQQGIKFFDLSPSEKMTMFSSIMGNTILQWDDWSNKCKTLAIEIEGKINKLKQEIAHLQGQIQGSTLATIEQDSEEWENAIKDQIQTGETFIQELTTEIKDKKQKSLSITKTITKLEKEEQVQETKLTKLQTELIKSEKNLVQVQEETKAFVNDFNRLDKELGKFKGMNNTCPYCGQKVTAQHIEREVQKLKEEQQEKTSCIVKNRGKQAGLERSVQTYKEQYTKLNSALKLTQKDLDFTKTDLVHLESYIRECNEKIKTETASIKELQQRTNPYLELKKRNKRKIDFLNRRVMYTSYILKETEQDLEIVTFWKKGFKEIRLMVIEEALKELELQINNNIQQLGMPDWQIVLDIEKETKRGTLSSGFTIKVLSPYNSELVPFKSWSGGEGQRLRLAGTMGLIDFIHSRRGLDWDIEIYDEPSQFLSEEGIDDLLEILMDRARSTQKRIFIVDQRSLHTRGEFSGIIEITKDVDGSWIRSS